MSQTPARLYRPCHHNTYFRDLGGVLLRVPCPEPGCPGAIPVTPAPDPKGPPR